MTDNYITFKIILFVKFYCSLTLPLVVKHCSFYGNKVKYELVKFCIFLFQDAL